MSEKSNTYYESVAKSLQCCASDSEPCEHCNCELEECNPKTIMEIAADAIEELLAAVPHWHPVSEPPKENKEYLVYIPNVGLVTKANYLYGEWNYDSLHMKINHLVSHWMPLPEPPKEDAE